MSELTPQDERDEIERIVNDLEVRRRIERNRVFGSVYRCQERLSKSRLEIAGWRNDFMVVSLRCDFGSMSHEISRRAAYELVERVSAWLQETATDEGV